MLVRKPCEEDDSKVSKHQKDKMSGHQKYDVRLEQGRLDQKQKGIKMNALMPKHHSIFVYISKKSSFLSTQPNCFLSANRKRILFDAVGTNQVFEAYRLR